MGDLAALTRQALDEVAASGELGRVLYLYTNRVNFGKVRTDENALWSLAPHDISLALALAGERPSEVSARGQAFLQPGIEDVVFGYLQFPSGLVAHLHVSWLDPHKRRALTVVGTERMVVFDDTEVDRKVTLYEKTSIPKRFETWGEFQALQSGDIRIPRVPGDEPLRLEAQAFVNAIRTGEVPIAAGDEGLDVSFHNAEGHIGDTPYRERITFSPFGPVTYCCTLPFGPIGTSVCGVGAMATGGAVLAPIMRPMYQPPTTTAIAATGSSIACQPIWMTRPSDDSWDSWASVPPAGADSMSGVSSMGLDS